MQNINKIHAYYFQ